jgi:hypothetical protein
MEALFMKANLFSIVEGTKIDLGAKNLALQVAWKNKNAQAQCELILNISDRQVQSVKALKTLKKIGIN